MFKIAGVDAGFTVSWLELVFAEVTHPARNPVTDFFKSISLQKSAVDVLVLKTTQRVVVGTPLAAIATKSLRCRTYDKCRIYACGRCFLLLARTSEAVPAPGLCQPLSI